MAEPDDASSFRTRWRVLDAPDEADVDALEAETGLPRAVCYLLVQRGVAEAEDVDRYLAPSLDDDLHDPFAMKGMAELVDRLLRARERGATVGIHGDYDVDGLTSTTFLTRVLEAMDFEVVPFVPHRMKDGYGVSDRALDELAEAGVDVLVTCDTGIGEHETLGRAVEELGMEVCVLDHHLPDDVLPPAQVVVNPHQEGCDYPFKDLCAAGLAYKLGEALCEADGRDPAALLDPHLDLVGLGTICDVVPLVDENRVFAHHGLSCARRTENQGLRALYEVVDISPEAIDERTFGWVLGPRLNAVGRIDDAAKGLDLLDARDSEEANALAEKLHEVNHERRLLSDAIERDAMRRLEADDGLEDRDTVVLFGGGEGDEEAPEWHHGVLGIVASRVANRLGRPTLLFAKDAESGRWKGSGRSQGDLEGVHLRDALAACREHLEAFGGHEAAAGATLAGSGRAAQEAFREAFEAAVARQLADGDRRPVATADLELELDRINTDLHSLIERFAPFGEANEPVTFLARGVRVVRAQKVGRAMNHVKLTVEQNGVRFDALGWHMATELAETVETPVPYEADLLFRVEQNTYRGQTSLQLVIEDLRVGSVEVEPTGRVARGRRSGPDADEAITR